MPSYKQFKLPDLGEGLTEGEIIRWLVGPGDEVKLNQPIVEVETAKAAVEVPSPYAGVVSELLHAEGDTVDVGSPLLTFDTGPGAPEEAAAAPPEVPVVPPDAGEVSAPPEDGAVEPGLIGGPAPGGRTSVLVGYGPRSGAAKRRPRKAPTSTGEVAEQGLSTSDLATPPSRETGAEVGANAQRNVAVLAKPPVRKLAKDLGVDLTSVAGTGPHGTITRDDVESASEPRAAEPGAAEGGATMPGRAGGEQRIPVKGVRKHTAAAMTASAFTAPHVTEFVTVDVTRTVEAVARLRDMPDWADLRVSPLLLVAKALLLAVRRNPLINSSWDEDAQEIVVKDQVNLGIAAATPRGLIVPNIKSAERLPLRELAEAMAVLVETARAGRTPPADMQGGTITVTNVGVFGVDTGTPILNPGESAILAFGQIAERPWVVDHAVVPRMVTTLAVSFDHRVVDGELGSKFLADIAAFLHDPEAALLAWS